MVLTDKVADAGLASFHYTFNLDQSLFCGLYVFARAWHLLLFKELSVSSEL